MPKKCRVKFCRHYNASLGKEDDKVAKFRLPSDPSIRQSWISKLKEVNGDDWTIKQDTVICERHWPEGYEKCKIFRSRHERPRHPPSVFPTFTNSGSMLQNECQFPEIEDDHDDVITFCKVSTPRDSKQSSSVKIAKLSD